MRWGRAGVNSGRVDDFYAGRKKGGALCTRFRELFYTKGVRGEGQQNCATQRGGSGEFEHGLPPFAPALPPSK